MKKTKILYIDHAPLMGGAELSLLSLLKKLDRSRFEPILACPKGSRLAEEAAKAGVRVEHASLEQLRTVRNPVTLMYRIGKGVDELVRLVKREDIDIIHANVMRSSIYGALLTRLTHTPLVWHVRDIHREKVYTRLMSRFAARIVAISKAVAEVLPNGARDKVAVIYNGLDLGEFDLTKEDIGGFRQELGVKPDDLLVGNVAWISPWKGQELFLNAAERVAEQQNNVRFVVVGDAAHERHADYYRQLKERAEEKLGNKVIFTGARSDTNRVMAGLDVLVHCAQDEPFGRVLIEAMAVGKPVVAIKGGGANEIIVDGVTGFLTPKGDMAALSEAILKLHADHKLVEKMGRAGRSRVESTFSLPRHVKEVERVYESLLLSR